MLVSHQHKFIYTKTVKTAGSSVESYFEPYCISAEEYSQRRPGELHESAQGIIGYGPDRPADAKWYNHMPALAIKRQLGDEIWNNYFKFCVIRNPFDKAVSAYYFFKDRESNRAKIEERRPLLRKIQSKLMPKSQRDDPRRLFESWVLDGGMIWDRDKYMIDGEICVDAFIRFENLQADIRSVCDRLGLEFDPGRIPHHKKQTRDKRLSLSEMFTRKSVDAISKLYRFEIEHFGYEPPAVG